MTYKCNGCGGEFDALAGVLAYGDASFETMEFNPVESRQVVDAAHNKTLCPRCQHVLKDILISSDLSDHWHKYEWSLMVDNHYMEDYDGT